MKYSRLLIEAIGCAVEAGNTIMEVYRSDFAVEAKEDKSPLTLADKKSHEIIQAALTGFEIPLISEEGKHTPYDIRKAWDTCWIVDPLDGTKEFVKRNGEFTVNIALIENQRPVLGVVYAPVKKWLYFATVDTGSYKVTIPQPDTFSIDRSMDAEDQLQALVSQGSKLPIDQRSEVYTIVGSRSHGTPDLEAFVEAKKREKGDVAFIAAGSSLKICLVAEGAADIYPRLAPTMEWDTAAGQAVAECAGARIYVHGSGEMLRYNRQDMLNPWFIVER